MNSKATKTFSLIMATVGRSEEVKNFLEHLDCQTYHDFELIVVDQNPDHRLVPILEPYKERFPILHLRSETGLSRARNLGLKHISGDIVGFPDDDCWYPQELLSQVRSFFEEHPEADALTGQCLDESGVPLPGPWDRKAGLINPFNLWKRHRSSSIFLRKMVVQTVGGFDESLGLGAETPYKSGEETDYLLRALRHGYLLYYDPRVVIYHPRENFNVSNATNKALNYARGTGRVLRMHRYPLWFLAYWELRSLVGFLLALLHGDKGRALVYLAAFKGRLQGWRGE